jgi:hypothetical protein
MQDRDSILRALEFPRLMLGCTIARETCRHDGEYQPSTECRICSQATECEWLVRNDSPLAPDHRNSEELLEELILAAHCIRGRLRSLEHPISQCQCPTCHWLRTVRVLFD